MSDNTMGGKIIEQGSVTVKKPFKVKYFNEDDGWLEKLITPGTYDYRVLNVRGWKPRQLNIDGDWFDVMDQCEELEDILNKVDETTGVGNIAPTVDYMGHINPYYIPGMEPVYSDEITDKPKTKKDKEDPQDKEWISPLGRLVSGESVRRVIGVQFGLFEDVEDDLLKNLDAFNRIDMPKRILEYPGTLEVKTAYPHKNTFGMRLEDPDISEYYKKFSTRSFPPAIIVELVFDPNSDYEDTLNDLDHKFYELMVKPDWNKLKDYFKTLIPNIPELKQCSIRQR